MKYINRCILILLFTGFIIKEGTSTSKSNNQTPIERYQTNSIEDIFSQDGYDIKFYKIDLEVTDTSIFISGSTTILVEILLDNTNKLFFELAGSYSIDSVVVNNVIASYNHKSDTLFISLPGALHQHSYATIQIFYNGKAYEKGEEYGIYNRETNYNNKRYTWTLSEPFESKFWFPCKQNLADKADSVYVFITTEYGLKAGANGILENITNLPGNKLRYEWKSHYPIAYYLISFAVGDFIDYSFYTKINSNADSILVQNYIYNNSAFFANNKSKIDKTGDLLNLFSRLYGPYPFANEKYGHCIVPMGGGMEHQTMTSLANFSFLLVAHELSHQWFGDNVTCSNWQDIWINEGFASYSEYLANEYLESREDADLWMKDAHQYAMNEQDGSVHVPGDYAKNDERIFDYRLSYKKGAAIIHMIRQEINDDELFFETLRSFQKTFKDSVASVNDFKSLLEEKTSINFDLFFNEWFYGEGYPKFKISWQHRNDSLLIYSLQESSTPKTPLFNTLLEFKVLRHDLPDTSLFFRQESQYDEFIVQLPGRVNNLIFDPNHWLLMSVLSFKNLTDTLNANKSFTISPNPVSNKLLIRFLTNIESYKIYMTDFSGKIIKIEEANDKNHELNLSEFAKGIYLLLIEVNDTLFPTKIIKV